MKLFNQLEALNVSALLRAPCRRIWGRATSPPPRPSRRDSAAARIFWSRKRRASCFAAAYCSGEIFRLAGAEAEISACAYEGRILERGDTAAVIEGRLAGLLIGERTALNLVQLMSGIATMTRRYVDAVKGTGARIIDTRKTHPGLRMIEKYAVRAGGGFNHRFGLDSGVLIKENHIAAAGSVSAALEGARRLAPHTMRIEIECETLAQVEEALANGADSILLDNMTPDDVRRARTMAPAGASCSRSPAA